MNKKQSLENQFGKHPKFKVAQHTPTPFEALDGDIWSGQKLVMIGNLPSKEIDAAYIARAANRYQAVDELIQAAKYALQFVGVYEAKDYLEKAIAKAEGK